ncbi:MAG: PKD domain-containing protein [Solirubrobacterales bacterium]
MLKDLLRWALAATIVALAVPGSALAAPTWLTPTTLSAGSAAEPGVAVDPAGDSIAVWERESVDGEVVQAASRAAGGGWGSPVDLSVGGENAYRPQVAVDQTGEAVAVWYRYDGTNWIAQAASRTAGGDWGAPVDLSATGEDALESQVAIDQAGEAVAVWERFDGSNEIIEAATRTAAGVWLAPLNLSAGGENAHAPQVAVDPGGDAVAVWHRSDGSTYVVQATTRAAGGGWQPPVDLSAPGVDAKDAQVAVDQAGDAVAVWEGYEGGHWIAQAASRPAGGIWGSPVDLSASGVDASELAVALDQAGDAVVAWDQYDGSTYVAEAASRAAGGSWQSPVDLSTAGGIAYGPRVALDPGGDAVAVWSRDDGGSEKAQAAIRPAGGSWGAPVDLSAADGVAPDPQVAVDSEGDATAVWQATDGTEGIVQAAGLDVAGPQLRGLSIPASGKAGASLSFSVSPFDVWSVLGTTSWTFGDGGTASGTAVSHAFAKAGTYTVSVTGTDAVGNASTATGTVTIAAATRRRRKARARRIVRVKGRVGLLSLRCDAGARCGGTVRLSVRATTSRGATASAGRRRRRITFGKKAFTLAAGRHTTIKVPLTKKGRVLVAAAGRRGLAAHLAGSGVVGRAVVLKAAGHRRGSR